MIKKSETSDKRTAPVSYTVGKEIFGSSKFGLFMDYVLLQMYILVYPLTVQRICAIPALVSILTY